MILNCGCGQNKINNCINIDIEPLCKPDLIADFTQPLPFPHESIDKIYFFHVIEHIPKVKHGVVLAEFRRLLSPAGVLVVSYPEFITVANYWMINHKGMRDFWEHTIYGRQLYPSDFHVALMHTPEFVEFLSMVGFEVTKRSFEIGEEYNTVLKCQKSAPMTTYEDILREEIFGVERR